MKYKTQPFKAGHMRKGYLVLPATPDRIESLSRAANRHNTIQKLPKAQLDWVKK